MKRWIDYKEGLKRIGLLLIPCVAAGYLFMQSENFLEYLAAAVCLGFSIATMFGKFNP